MDITYANTNLETWGPTSENIINNWHLDGLKINDDFWVWVWWERWIKNSLVLIAQDLKNLFFGIAILFLLILVIKLLVWNKTDEEVTNFKKWIIWISVWIIITQISYTVISVLFDENIEQGLANDFVEIIIEPFIRLLETATSFVFLAIMIYAFFRMVTANWDEEKAKTWKISVLYAIVWFVVVKFASAIVRYTYWERDCDPLFATCDPTIQLSKTVWIIVTIINWVNTFVWIVVVLMVVYAGFLVLISGWNEDKLKKAKYIIIYIVIWLFILVFNWLILTFFLIPESGVVI